jgi:hypothetical protein
MGPCGELGGAYEKFPRNIDSVRSLLIRFSISF